MIPPSDDSNTGLARASISSGRRRGIAEGDGVGRKGTQRENSMQRRSSATRGMEKHTIDKPSDHQRRSTAASAVRRATSMRPHHGSSSTDKSSLEASSYHVSRSNKSGSGNATSLSSSSSHNRRSCGPVLNHRSSDNMEQRTGRGDLGAATLHGNSAVSRIRSGSKSTRNLDSYLGAGSGTTSGSNSQISRDGPDAIDPNNKTASGSNSSKPDRRAQMKRAMSRENVKRPEEYAKATNTHAVHEPEARRGGRRPSKQLEPAVVEEEEEEVDSEEDESSTSSEDSGSSFGGESEAEACSSRFASSLASRKSFTKQQQPTLVRHSDNNKRHETSRSAMTPSSHASTSNNSSNSSTSSNDSSNSSTVRSGKKTHQQAQTNHNLLHLMREGKTVQLHDLQDQKNRRMLHFLLYQHKLGVDMAQLRADIHDDITTNGFEEALSRPPLPLYVEPAN